MAKPIVAIVGRPNVGKSTLFNKLIGERRSIVEDTPGVTRDRIYGETEWCSKKLVIIDTGGIEPKTVAHCTCTRIGQAVDIHLLRTELEEVVVCLFHPLLALLASTLLDWLNHFDSPRFCKR